MIDIKELKDNPRLFYVFERLTSYIAPDFNDEKKRNMNYWDYLQEFATHNRLNEELFRNSARMRIINNLTFITVNTRLVVYERLENILYLISKISNEEDVISYLNEQEKCALDLPNMTSNEFFNIRRDEIMTDNDGRIIRLYEHRGCFGRYFISRKSNQRPINKPTPKINPKSLRSLD